MTIASLFPAPVAPATTPGTMPTSEGEGAPADFLAALESALTAPPAVVVDESVETPVPVVDESVETPTTMPSDPEIALQVGATPATPAVPAHRADPATARPDERRGNGATPATPAVPAHRRDVAPTTPVGEAPTPVPVPGAEHRSATGTEHQRADQAPGRVHAAERPALNLSPVPSGSAGPTGSTSPISPTDPAAEVHPEKAPAAPAAPTTTPQPGTGTALPTPVQITAPTAPVAPIAPVATATSLPSAQLDQVTAQVFGEVTGLVSRGPGTHRISLTLQPEHLGEVRVVMTMRDGAVHVRLAAGHDARISLTNGSAELTRLLEQAGITETRIVVRELPAAATQPSSTLPTSGHLDAQLSADRGPTQDQHAGKRADHLATDGADHPRNHRSPVMAEVRPIPTVNTTRNAGVDLTM